MPNAPQRSRPEDFDFFLGRWRVTHRRLRRRLQDCADWDTFLGTTHAWPVLGGYGNIDDNELELPSGRYRAVTLRTFDPACAQWSIWWLDGRAPDRLDPPMRGAFADGVGVFFADDTFEGRPIRVRFIWSDITPHSARWQQAFSADGGSTWETNWVMDFERADVAGPASDATRAGR